MAGQINYQITNSAYPTGSSPLSASYLQLGSSCQSINVALAAAGVVVPQANSFGAPGSLSGDLVAVFLVASQPLTIQTNGAGTIGVQTITTSGGATGGTLVLGFNGQITSNIAYNASAATIQTALRALSTIGGTNVTCSGGPLGSAAVTCTFSGSLINQTVPLLTSNISGLTGGSPAIAIANASGTPQDVIQLAANIPVDWDTLCGLTCPFLGAVTEFYITNTNACTLKGSILTF
jgi:hypothetical protein